MIIIINAKTNYFRLFFYSDDIKRISTFLQLNIKNSASDTNTIVTTLLAQNNVFYTMYILNVLKLVSNTHCREICLLRL